MSKNDITGDSLTTKAATNVFRENYDNIFRKDTNEFHYEGRALREGEWLPWHTITFEVYENRRKWPREGYEVRATKVEQ